MTEESEQSNVCPKCDAELSVNSSHCPVCLLENAVPASGGLTSSDLTDSVGLESVPVSEKAGDAIGDYKLLEKIGEGGFGVVYMAKQERPVRRKVALKIIKLGMDTRQVVGRFEAERQALAMMDHPNIAKVLDAGSTETGRPYFVMELVHGIPITEFCDENRFDTRQRIDLCVRVCHAVQHAHQKGIIHRDLKPSNVLVTMHDDIAVPKIIDFGIAKATEHELTDVTLFTQFRHFLGTPAYMSPEQAQMTGLGVDTRSDIYSLGVLLYELLTGFVPLDLQGALKSGYDEIRRCIREEEPSKPSTRLSQLSEKESTTLSTRRRSQVSTLQSQLKGDLDWIVMKAMEKDRTRRYETANGMANDLEAYLKDDPVSAVAPSAWYLLTKLARRHKPVFASLAIVLPILLLTTAISISMFLSERETRQNFETLSRKSVQQLKELRQRDEENLQFNYAKDIRAADRLIREKSYIHAENSLNRYIPVEGSDTPDLREFAWYYLKEQILQNAPRRLSFGKGVRNGRLRYSPDGRFLAIATDNGRISIWDNERERVLHETEFRNTTDSTFPPRLDFSHDARFLAAYEDPRTRPVGSERLRIQVWQIGESGMHHVRNLIYSPQPHVDTVGWYVSGVVKFVPGTSVLAYNVVPEESSGVFHGIAFSDVEEPNDVINMREAGSLMDISPNGDYLISMVSKVGGFEYTLWDRVSGERIKTESHSEEFGCTFWDNESVLLASRAGKSVLKLKTIPSLDEIDAPLLPLRMVSYVLRAYQGSYIALMRRRECIIWDKDSEKVVFTLETRKISQLPVLSHDGAKLARWAPFGDGKWGVEIHSTAEPKETELKKLSRVVPHVQVTQDAAFLKFQGQSHSKRFSLPRLDSSRLLEVPGQFIGQVGAEEYWMVEELGDAEKYDRVFCVGGASAKNEFVTETAPIEVFELSDERLLFVYYWKSLEIRDRAKLEVLGEPWTSERQRWYPSVVPELNLAMIVFYDDIDARRIAFMDLRTLEIVEWHPGEIGRLVGFGYVPSEQVFLIAYDTGHVERISVIDFAVLERFEFSFGVDEARFSHDGKTVAVARRTGAGGGIELYSLKSRQFLISLDGNILIDGVFNFGPNDDTIFRTSANLTAIRWWSAPRP